MTVSEPIDHVGRPLNDPVLPGGRRPKRWMTSADDAAGVGLLSGAANVIMELARPGVGYGVKDSHYDSVGVALLWTLEQGLGAAWSDEAAVAWKEVYGLLSSIMRNAQHEASAKAAA